MIFYTVLCALAVFTALNKIKKMTLQELEEQYLEDMQQARLEGELYEEDMKQARLEGEQSINDAERE